MDAVNRRVATETLLEFALDSADKQYVLLTPQVGWGDGTRSVCVMGGGLVCGCDCGVLKEPMVEDSRHCHRD